MCGTEVQMCMSICSEWRNTTRGWCWHRRSGHNAADVPRKSLLWFNGWHGTTSDSCHFLVCGDWVPGVVAACDATFCTVLQQSSEHYSRCRYWSWVNIACQAASVFLLLLALLLLQSYSIYFSFLSLSQLCELLGDCIQSFAIFVYLFMVS